jgi:SET and MYND domain-containing protein
MCRPGSSGPVAIWVGYAPGAGRGVFAVRDIPVGDLIHTADPVVAHPTLASPQKVGSTSSP